VREREPDNVGHRCRAENQGRRHPSRDKFLAGWICREKSPQERCAQSIFSLGFHSFSHDIGWFMPRRLPPLNAVRHESLTRAAEELCVTPGAVSH
jgi:hypothetical protein